MFKTTFKKKIRQIHKRAISSLQRSALWKVRLWQGLKWNCQKIFLICLLGKLHQWLRIRVRKMIEAKYQKLECLVSFQIHLDVKGATVHSKNMIAMTRPNHHTSIMNKIHRIEVHWLEASKVSPHSARNLTQAIERAVTTERMKNEE